uniref:Uncharacterized protein n=1 Tax=uncultured Armatimonadetes bacterium TaxID=157466 RepID=A0A6J4H5K1_9BACT|nr:hypothetical protein AVDCRST_MAG63-154 [uncultured Armatimonadetes bacterium]
MRKGHDGGHGHGHGHDHVVGIEEGRDPDQLRKLGYEPRDIAVATLVKWWGALFVFVALMLGLVFAVYNRFLPDERETEAEAMFPMATQRELPPPDAPRLQAYPKRDWVEFDRGQKHQVNAYDWINPKKNIVQIPVDQAIEVLAERGLPRRTPAATQAARNAPRSGNTSIQNTGPTAPVRPGGGRAVPPTPPAGAPPSGGGAGAAGGGAGLQSNPTAGTRAGGL